MSVAREVNEILRATYLSKRTNGDRYSFRIMFTKYPKPTLSIVVWENRQKLVEIPIENLDEFVDSINSAYDVLDKEGLLEAEPEPEEPNENENEENEERRTRSRRYRPLKSYAPSSKRSSKSSRTRSSSRSTSRSSKRSSGRLKRD